MAVSSCAGGGGGGGGCVGMRVDCLSLAERALLSFPNEAMADGREGERAELAVWARRATPVWGSMGSVLKTSKVKLVRPAASCSCRTPTLHPLLFFFTPQPCPSPSARRSSPSQRRARRRGTTSRTRLRPFVPLPFSLPRAAANQGKSLTLFPLPLPPDLQIKESASKWTYLWLFNVGDMRNSHLKEVRSQWRGSVLASLPPLLRSRGLARQDKAG